GLPREAPSIIRRPGASPSSTARRAPPLRSEQRMAGRLTIALLWLACAAAAHAETAYVTAILQLGLHQASVTSDRPLHNLPSGTRPEILERTALYARVRTVEGAEGWVKAGYLVSETPARYRLAELESRLEALDAELAAARATEKQATAEAELLRSREAEHKASGEIGRAS